MLTIYATIYILLKYYIYDKIKLDIQDIIDMQESEFEKIRDLLLNKDNDRSHIQKTIDYDSADSTHTLLDLQEMTDAIQSNNIRDVKFLVKLAHTLTVLYEQEYKLSIFESQRNKYIYNALLAVDIIKPINQEIKEYLKQQLRLASYDYYKLYVGVSQQSEAVA
jgi:hypothetical protein